MEIVDQRIKCGCHRKCTVLEHECENPCIWPKCLTPEEAKAELEALREEEW
jgi:hypothetical protein